MRKFILVVPIIGLLSSCGLFHFVEKKENSVPPALSLKTALHEFRQTKWICGFELDPSDTVANEKICSYPVKNKFNKLDAYYKHAIEFLLSDSTSYLEDYVPIKQPFYPTFAFKPSKKSTFSCFLSFGTEEIAFSSNDSTYITFRVKNIHRFKLLRDEIIELNSSKR